MDINKATAEQLEQAFQVDGTRARYLIDRRNKSGAFRSWDDVKQVPGFEDKMVENLQRAGLTIGGASQERGSARNNSGQSGRGRGLDINTASQQDLETVFEMDGTRARYLVEARNRIGGFRSWDQIKQEVPSFEDGMIRNMQDAGATLGRH